MAEQKRARRGGGEVVDFRYDATRKNNPPAGLAGQGRLQEAATQRYSYDPHLPPTLRFDSTGREDGLPELLETAKQRPLTPQEAQQLADALRNHQPWLEWAGKREARGFDVEPVALNIHERVSAQAILKVAAHQQVQRSLFADPEMEYREAVQFYQHDVDWANRLILGDSLQVMASLIEREGLGGKVQMIYVDPPYGINFRSNFQSEIGKRDVSDRDTDLTREPEMIKAYRDTWALGVHSYLAYLKDRLVLSRGLLTDSGSIFVQIGEENVHLIRSLLDEVYGPTNFISLITFTKTSSATTTRLPSTADYLLWYGRDSSRTKFHQPFAQKISGAAGGTEYYRVEFPDGHRRVMTETELGGQTPLPVGTRPYRLDNLTSQSIGREKGEGAASWFPVGINGRSILPNQRSRWKTNEGGMARLLAASRVEARANSLSYIRFLDDFPVFALNNNWTDTGIAGRVDGKQYVVETSPKVVERCLLMTTDPGDLVLDPTSGSGTTARVAEQWGRRWIAIDTSRVANAIARERILTAAFPMYRVKGEDADNPSAGFVYRTVPHITLKSIAQNPGLDPIFAKHQGILDQKFAALNDALTSVTPEIRQQLMAKLAAKERAEGKRAVTDADRRRWVLPKDGWQEWEVPYDADPDWPQNLQSALQDFRAAWRAKMDEVNAAIAASAEQEELVDQPEVVRGVTRVAGPFTVEAVIPPEESLDVESPIGGAPEELETFAENGHAPVEDTVAEAVNAEAYLDKMLRLLKADGIRFPNNRHLTFSQLEPLTGVDYLHAEGEWQSEDGKVHLVAVSFGPEFGPVTAYQVEQALPMAARRGYDDLVFAGFSFDAAAQATIEEDPNPRLRCHLAHIRPDVNMGGLLKDTPNSQVFTVFGLPRTELRRHKDGSFSVEMQGVDIYDPVANTVFPTKADKVAAWFLDADYDGRTFCITQAFFPDKDAWAKLSRALKGFIDEERFAQLAGTASLPFPAGKYRRAAIKVIDPRGNEVMALHKLDGEATYGA